MKQIEARISSGRTQVKLFSAGQTTFDRIFDLLSELKLSAIGRDDLKEPANQAEDVLRVLHDRIDAKPEGKPNEVSATAKPQASQAAPSQAEQAASESAA